MQGMLLPHTSTYNCFIIACGLVRPAGAKFQGTLETRALPACNSPDPQPAAQHLSNVALSSLLSKLAAGSTTEQDKPTEAGTVTEHHAQGVANAKGKTTFTASIISSTPVHAQAPKLLSLYDARCRQRHVLGLDEAGKFRLPTAGPQVLLSDSEDGGESEEEEEEEQGWCIDGLDAEEAFSEHFANGASSISVSALKHLDKMHEKKEERCQQKQQNAGAGLSAEQLRTQATELQQAFLWRKEHEHQVCLTEHASVTACREQFAQTQKIKMLLTEKFHAI